MKLLISALLMMLCSVTAQSEGDFCAAKFEDGKLVSEDDYENQSGSSVLCERDAKAKERDQCEFIISDICYRSYLSFSYDKAVNFAEAQQICADEGSVPAIFPTELDYNKTVESLRAKMKAVGSRDVTAYTGVVMNGKTSAVIYPDTDVFVKWYPEFPRLCKVCTNVFIHVDLNPKSINQGMINYPPSSRRSGVVCQNNLN